MTRVFPDRPLVDVPLVASRSITRSTTSRTACRRCTSTTASRRAGFGIFLGDRLAVFYTYESDLGNGWEDPETYKDPPALHEAALRMGVNLFVYAVTSRPTP